MWKNKKLIENSANKCQMQSTCLLCISVPQTNTDSSALTQIEQRCCDFSVQKRAPSANRTAPWRVQRFVCPALSPLVRLLLQKVVLAHPLSFHRHSVLFAKTKPTTFVHLIKNILPVLHTFCFASETLLKTWCVTFPDRRWPEGMSTVWRVALFWFAFGWHLCQKEASL